MFLYNEVRPFQIITAVDEDIYFNTIFVRSRVEAQVIADYLGGELLEEEDVLLLCETCGRSLESSGFDGH